VPSGWTPHVLLIDTETTIDPTQRLLFGSYQFASWQNGELVTREEGLFFDDDLPERDPGGYAVLSDYAAQVGLKLTSRRVFLDTTFWRAAHQLGATVVGFNLPFDLSRLATSWSEARGTDVGAFSFTLWDRVDKPSGQRLENKYRPRLIIQHVNAKCSFIRFKGGRDIPKHMRTRGFFLDLRTLLFALTSKGHSLASGCAAFGIKGKAEVEAHGVITTEYIDYNREDVRATRDLLVALRREFERYPIKLDPCRAYSPAAIAKACMDAMGVPPAREQFASLPEDVHGYAMISYYGGRADVRMRRTLAPVVTVDFLSMYPTVNALMDTWHHLIAGDLTVVDQTEEARELLERIQLDDCFDPEAWKQFIFLAEVDPHDDVLPVRTEYDGQNRNIGVNYLARSSTPIWYTGPDLVASKLMTGRVPTILKAFTLRPTGRTAGLKPIDFGYGLRVDPGADDAFRKLIELRKSLAQRGLDEHTARRVGDALKIVANSGAYGVLAEMNVRDRRPKDPATVYGLEAFETDADKTEEPGRFCFPYVATMTTGAARLMLAMLERCVIDKGGSYVFCDTDSMAIVASRDGGTLDVDRERIRVLSWAEVEAIRERFAALNPYDRSIIKGSILQLEPRNTKDGGQRQLYAWAISAKRYALLEEFSDGLKIEKESEHGLGHLLNPADADADDEKWMRRLWRWIIDTETTGGGTEPVWLDRLALTRITASSPALLDPFDGWNDGREYGDQVKPFNFLLSANVTAFGHPVGTDPTRFHLVARYEREPDKWDTLEWIERYSGKVVRVTTRAPAPPDHARLKTIRDVVESFKVHPEPKSADSDGLPCGPASRGLLRRRSIVEAGIRYIGKESHKYDEVDARSIHDPDEVTVSYRSDEWERLKGRLHDYPATELARVGGVSVRSIKHYRAGREPRRAVKRRLLAFVRRSRGRG